jgi:hypothetical protein
MTTLKNVVDSPLTAAAQLLIENGFVVTEEIKNLITNDKSLTEQLKEIGSVLTDLVVGKVMDRKSSKKITEYAAGKLAEAVYNVGTDLATGSIPEDAGDMAVYILESAAEFVPAVGAAVSEYNKVMEITSRIGSEGKAAFEEFRRVQTDFRRDTDNLNNEFATRRLELIIRSASSS